MEYHPRGGAEGTRCPSLTIPDRTAYVPGVDLVCVRGVSPDHWIMRGRRGPRPLPPMIPTPAELKKTLIARGFEVYRTLGDQVVLADRVRDNLIMDSGVAVRVGAPLSVRFVVRAQASDFPSVSADDLYERARASVSDAQARGYAEVGVAAVPVRDPGDASSTLGHLVRGCLRTPRRERGRPGARAPLRAFAGKDPHARPPALRRLSRVRRLLSGWGPCLSWALARGSARAWLRPLGRDICGAQVRAHAEFLSKRWNRKCRSRGRRVLDHRRVCAGVSRR